MTTDAYNEQGDLARAMGVTPLPDPNDDNWCVCGAEVAIGWVGDRRVRICRTNDHVVLDYDPRVFIHVENAGDVIDAPGHADTCARRQIGAASADPDCTCGLGTDE